MLPVSQISINARVLLITKTMSSMNIADQGYLYGLNRPPVHGVNHTEKVGVVDSEYIVHQGIQTLGSSSGKKTDNSEDSAHAAN
ncbi:hypothetical protein Ancab_033775 [Ancistrocladus abbreviatus]